MKRVNTKKLVLASVFASLTCVATLIHIPATATGGYINIGDCLVIASGLLLGAKWGALAGGIGAGLADIALGYTIYAPGTLFIKGAMAFCASVLYNFIHTKLPDKKGDILGKIVAIIVAEIIMVAGYVFYEAIFLSYGYGAIASLPGNLMQALAGLITTIPLTKVIERTKLVK